MEAALAAMAPHAGCQRLELVWHSRGSRPVELLASRRLASLPHVRSMEMSLMDRTMASLSLPMPSLEELRLPEVPEMFAPIVTRGVALGVQGRGVPYPRLRRLSVASTAVILNPAAGGRGGRGARCTSAVRTRGCTPALRFCDAIQLCFALRMIPQPPRYPAQRPAWSMPPSSSSRPMPSCTSGLSPPPCPPP